MLSDNITSIKWSPDDNFIMAVTGKSNTIELRCFNSDIVENQSEGWSATIQDQLGGIEEAMWSADSRQILTWSESNLRVSVWSLISASLTAYVNSPKMLPPKGIDFSENKKFVALAERKDSKDIVGIYYAGNEWKMVNQILVDTNDLQDLKWSNGDTSILVWDCPFENQILIYSVATAELLTKYQPESIGLGIKTVSVSPDKNLMAAGMFDGSIFLYNNLVA